MTTSAFGIYRSKTAFLTKQGNTCVVYHREEGQGSARLAEVLDTGAGVVLGKRYKLTLEELPVDAPEPPMVKPPVEELPEQPEGPSIGLPPSIQPVPPTQPLPTPPTIQPVPGVPAQPLPVPPPSNKPQPKPPAEKPTNPPKDDFTIQPY